MEKRPSFDVIRDPWIPVESRKDGNQLMGMRDVLLQSHELRGIRAGSPLYSYGVQRVLIAFLIDAFRPEDVDELAELIGKGRFDPRAIDDYIALCRTEGECFDLFDPERPFLQSAFGDERADTDDAVRLFPEWPEGNNHIHFNHVKEDEHRFSPAECALALCALTAYAMNCGRTSYFGINRTPPVYFLHAGETLFDTLARSMVSRCEHLNIELDDPPAAWRDRLPVPSGEPIARVSLLHGLTCQPRRVQLIPEQTSGETTVRKMWFSQGWNYKFVANWTDPHVAYTHKNKGVLEPLIYREERAVWRDMGSILPRGSRPLILNRIEEKLGTRPDASPLVPLRAYALTGKFKGVVYAAMSWFEEPLPLHLYLLKDELKTQFIVDCLEKMEGINRALIKTLAQSIRQLTGKSKNAKARGRYAQLTGHGQAIYLAACREYVMGELAETIKNAGTPVDWDIPLRKAVGARFKHLALAAFGRACAGLGVSASMLEWQATAQIALRGRINGCLKGGWMDERE